MVKKTKKSFFKSKIFTLILVLAAIIVMFGIISKNYLTFNNFRNIMYSASLAGIIGVGVCCILISGNCDLSAGAVGCFGGLVFAYCLNLNIPWFLCLIISLLYGALAGFINAFLVNVIEIPPFIGTMAMMSVWNGIGSLVTMDISIPVSNPTVMNIGGASLLQIPLPFIIMMILMLIYGIMLSNTPFGRKIYMIGGNRSSARLAGISVKKMNYFLFINCSTISAFSGAVLAARMRTASTAAVQGSQFTAITALVLGGVSFGGGSGSMLGGFIGILMLNAFNNGLSVIGFDSYWQICASGFLLIVALMIDYFNERSVAKNMKVKKSV